MIDVDLQFPAMSRAGRDFLRRKFAEIGTPVAPVNVTSPPKLELSGTALPSEVVRVLPGVSEESVVLTSYRANGRPFIRIELPAELAPTWVPYLERYTLRHDTTRSGPRLVD